jgi:hypothetical protein
MDDARVGREIDELEIRARRRPPGSVTMLAVDVYELSVDLAPGVRDLEFVAALDRYLTALQADGRIERWRLLRSKLGLGARSEFKVLIETRDLAQLDAAFAVVSTRANPIEEFHHGVNSLVTNFMLPCGATFQIRKGSLGRSDSDRVRPADDDIGLVNELRFSCDMAT